MRRLLGFGLSGGSSRGLAGCLTLALAVAVAAAAPAPAAGGGLDGKIFAVSTGRTGKPASDKDELIFKDDTLRSTACDTYGFDSARYTTAAGPAGATRFAARTTSPKEGTIDWRGDVRGDAVTGTYVWTKTGQPPIRYWFRGTLKK